ncbi:helix-turn-helix domain-containing protein [Pseudomonas gingeri]|uniref:Helix-turn-helix transcriptional regulator n=1 Tax=Pseudomonas gingeri TaxID=117681 RepID=A0A7Y8BQ93_9PSED|nr:helix-turn-helix transcriptional regulator [Pseudomonas gingeri]
MIDTDQKSLAGGVGRAIAKQRIRSGLTQKVSAERLGIGNEAVSRIERGVVVPNIERLAEFASICEGADLLTEASPCPDDQAARIGRLLSQLDDEDRQMVVELVECLAERLKKGESL